MEDLLKSGLQSVLLRCLEKRSTWSVVLERVSCAKRKLVGASGKGSYGEAGLSCFCTGQMAG